MDLEKKIEEIKEYFRSIELLDGTYYISVCYPETWTAYKSSNEDIQVIRNEQDNENVWWYYSKSGNIGLGMLFRMVEETIQSNLEAIKKAQLYASKVEELKKIFADETKQFKDLEKLTFNMGNVIKPTKIVNSPQKSSKKPKKNESPTNDTTIEDKESMPIENIEDTSDAVVITNDDLDALRG